MTVARYGYFTGRTERQQPLYLMFDPGLPTGDSLQAQAKYSPYALPVKQMTFRDTRVEKAPLEAWKRGLAMLERVTAY
jgi:hypothetical protein